MTDERTGDPGGVTTAAEIARMTPEERQAHFDASVVTDLSQVRPDFLARVQSRVRQRIAAQDASRPA